MNYILAYKHIYQLQSQLVFFYVLKIKRETMNTLYLKLKFQSKTLKSEGRDLIGKGNYPGFFPRVFGLDGGGRGVKTGAYGQRKF